ncbi:hypothetical protein [Streptomyces sp. TRM68367]|uniref:hypothetical protein n=1 Tax=Streptomyces sp. TRM68367 TaxID=2758415 RepID=UPI00165AE199|nr:hypothetical protein [Streptomyces sp. TRM68367]MBC9725777.1 hypothetical protein [Streptomyces sp. TRM68367]
MPDRSLRLLTLPPQPMQGGERSGVLLRERPASPPDASSGKKDASSGKKTDERSGAAQEDNPFAPPPEGSPDRPWQPRRPAGDDDESQSDEGRSPWGRGWSDRQPGRSSGGFGERPGGTPEGPGGTQPSGGLRWDPTDPAQRRARYALLSGMWAFFFALFSWPYVALLLGALSLYWGISALRAKPRAAADPDAPAQDTPGRPQTTAAVSGLVTASLAIALVAATFTAQLVYSDYYTCTNDALTNEAKQSCTDLLPKELRGLLGTDS